MNPPTHWYQRIPPSVRAERNRTRPARIRRVTTRAMVSTRVPVRKLHSAASRPCPKTVASSPFIRDWTDSSAPPTKASAAHSRRDVTSVGEVPGAGEVHRQPGRPGPLDDDVVADGAARGYDRADAGLDEHLEGVREGDERVRGGDRPGRALRAGPRDREPARVDPV